MKTPQLNEEEGSLELGQFVHVNKRQEEGIEFFIQHPVTMDDTTMRVVVAGPDSSRRKAAQRRYINNRIKKKKMKLDAEDIDRESKSVLAQCIISWSGFVLNGKSLECTPENVLMVFEQFPWIHDQIDERANDRTDFFKS